MKNPAIDPHALATQRPESLDAYWMPFTANAGEALLKTVVNNTGVIEAQTLGEKDGKIVLLGSFDGGTVQVAGTLDASAPKGGNGGFIETSGAHVKVADSAKVTTKAQSGKTGTWLIDPNDFTIAASGGDMSGAAVSAAVQSNNFEIQTATQGTAGGNGDIHVNDAITWSSANTLTLNAERNININAAITAQHASGEVALQYGQASTDGGTADYHIKAPINLQSGQNFSTQKGSTGSVVTYSVVNDAAALQAMKDNLSGNYALGSDINLSSISNWQPVGNTSTRFIGRLDGLGHSLSKLTINRSTTDFVGLFGSSSGSISNLGLVDADVRGNSYVGALAGDNQGTISHAYATGNITARFNYIGGLVGQNVGNISNAYSTASVTSTTGNSVGGLVGYNYGQIDSVYATGGVRGTYFLGGLVGFNNASGTISHTYATGTVSSSTDQPDLGGLVGNSAGTITASVWDSDSTGQNSAMDSGSGSIAEVTGSNRYNQSAYASLGTWSLVANTSDVYAASDANGVQWIMIEGQTRPFLASEYSTTINNAHQLQLMAYDMGASYTLANDIDASATTGSNTNGMWSTAGFVPVGDASTRFTGTLDGHGYTISGLTIDRSDEDFVGLFGHIQNATIENVGVVDGDVAGKSSVGMLVGSTEQGSTITNSFSTGSVVGSASFVGGLVGYSLGSVISDSYFSGTVSGDSRAGGLVGWNNTGGEISNSYAKANVTGGYTGGLVAYNSGGIIASFFANTDVDGNPINTGLNTVGMSDGSASIDHISGGRSWVQLSDIDTFTTEVTTAGGTAWDLSDVGGDGSTWRIYDGYTAPLLRSFLQSVTVTTDASTGNKTYDGSVATGNTAYTNNLGSGLDTGKLLGSLVYTSASKNAGTYSSADGTLIFSGLHSGQQGYDISVADTSLVIGKAALTVTALDASKTYDGLAFNSGNGVSYSGFVNNETSAVLGGTLSYGGNAQGATHAGNYVLSASGLGSDNYAISYTAGSLAIGKAALTITALDASKTYDGLAFSGGNGVSYSGFVNNETSAVLGGNLSYGGSAQGAINAGNYVLSASGLGSDNYAISYTAGSLLIGKASISAVTGITAQNRTYDGSTAATVNTGNAGFTGMVTGDDLSVSSATGSLLDKNAGTGKTVNITGITLGGGDAGNYTLLSDTASTTADIAKAAMTITANDASKTAGQGIVLSGYTSSGLVAGDSLSSVSLNSAGAPTSAAAGSYAIIASNAVGTGLSNYDIDYTDGTLLVSAAVAETTSPGTSPSYLAALTYNNQTVPTEGKQQAQESSALTPDMLVTNPLDERLNLQVINQGIRLPEGI